MPPTFSVRRMMLAAALIGASVSAFAQASVYPNRTITLIVPFSAGGSVDTAARMWAQTMSDHLKQSVVVENVAGAGGTLGTLRAVRAKADGHTLLFAVASPINVAPLVKPSIVKYDALKDLTPIATVATSPFVLIGSPKLAPRNTAELLDLARKSPGKLNYGTDGVGTSMHLTAEIIKLNAGIDIVHVPYKSGPQVLTELAGNLIELAVMPVTLAQPFIKEGSVRVFGVTSAKRWSTLPDVPALAETPVLKSVDVDSWYGVLAPVDTDAAVVQSLAKVMREVASDDTLGRKMQDAGLKPTHTELKDFAALLKRERATLAAAVKAAAIKPE